MESTTRIGLVVLGLALVMGIAADLLLRVGPWAFNATIWAVLLAAVYIVAAQSLKRHVQPDVRLLLVPFLIFAAALSIRDAPSLRLLNLAALVAITAAALLRGQTGRLSVATITEYTAGLLWAWPAALGRFLLLFGPDVQWRALGGEAGRAKAMATARGLAIAIPILLIFGALLVSADDVFGEYATNLFNWDFENICITTAMILAFAWIAGAVYRHLLIGHAFSPPRDVLSDERRVGITEIGIVLGSLDLLFLAFVIVQFKWFFGGDKLVQSPIPLTYSEYAHHGVYELVTVAALALTLLLGAHWALKKDSQVASTIFRALSLAMVALLFVIIASAWQRIMIYMDAYGLTVLRFGVAAIVLWLAAVFAWFVGTVLRGRPERFAFGAAVAAMAALLAANIANPEACVVRVNTGRRLDKLDVAYLAGLSADAVPDLVKALPKLSDAQRAEAAARLMDNWTDPDFADFRTMNLGRQAACDALHLRRAELARWGAPFMKRLAQEKAERREWSD